MRGKKLPELVADGIGQVLNDSLSEGQISLLVSHRTNLSNEQWSIIESDFSKGKQVLELEMRLKLDFCRRMPWLLALLAHSDHSNARRELSRALAEYDKQPDNLQKHHHFLTHQAFGKQFPLRKDMESFLHGVAIEDLPALLEFGACFRFVQITERYFEASHSVVKRKVPPNSAGPMVSLTRRLFRLSSDISIEPSVLQEVANVFESARVLKTLPTQLGLGAHPSLCALIGQKRVNWKIVKALNRVLYRIDVQSQFQDVAEAATASKQFLDKEKDTSAKLALAFQKFEKQKHRSTSSEIVHVPPVPRVGSYPYLRVQALQDHLIALSQHTPDHVFRLRLPKSRFGDLLTDILDDSFCNLPVLELTCDLQSTSLEESRDADPADGTVTFFFQVIYSRPSSRRVVPVSAAAAGRLNSEDIAVHVYKTARAANCSDNGLGSRMWLACAPQEGNACQVKILHDLTQFFSFGELCENLHLMIADNQRLYLLDDGFFRTDERTFRASTLITELVEKKCFKSVGVQAADFLFSDLPEQDKECLDDLIRFGLVERSSGGGLILTEASLSHVQLCRRYALGLPVHRALQSHTGMDPTVHDMLCRLEDAGFTWRAVKPKEALAYVVGEDKIWGTRGKQVHLENLQCLLQAESLRDQYGITKIPCCQKRSVYVDLLQGKEVVEELARPCLQLVDDLHASIQDAPVPSPLQLEDQRTGKSDSEAEDDLSIERLVQLFSEDVDTADLGIQNSTQDAGHAQPEGRPEQHDVDMPVAEPSMPSSSSSKAPDSIWIEVAGSPCIPWTPTSYGNSEQWLHLEVTLAYMCWVYGLLNQPYRLPDAIVHECVKGFDQETMFETVQERYMAESLMVSPEHVGLPVSRDRRFGLLTLRNHSKIADFCDETWEALFFCQPCMDATMFLQEDPMTIESYKHALAQKRKVPTDGRILSCEDVMTESERRVLLEMRSQILSIPPSQRPKAWFANLSQSIRFQPTIRNWLHCPTLMTSSRFFIDFLDHVECSRHIHPHEMLAMQLLPIFGNSDFRAAVENSGLHYCQLQRMAGNGMIAMVVGQIFLFILSSTCWFGAGQAEKRHRSCEDG
eukprot:s381_g16.t1